MLVAASPVAVQESATSALGPRDDPAQGGGLRSGADHILPVGILALQHFSRYLEMFPGESVAVGLENLRCNGDGAPAKMARFKASLGRASTLCTPRGPSISTVA